MLEGSNENILINCLDQGPAQSDPSIVLGVGLYAGLRSLASGVGVVPLKEVEVRKMNSFSTGWGMSPLLQRIKPRLRRVEWLFLSNQGCKWPELLVRLQYSDSRKISSSNSGKYQKHSSLNRSLLFPPDLIKQPCHQNQAKNGSPKWSEVMEPQLKGSVIVLTLSRWDQPGLPCCWEIAACGQAPGSGFAAPEGPRNNLPRGLCLTRSSLEFSWLYRTWVSTSDLASASQEATSL